MHWVNDSSLTVTSGTARALNQIAQHIKALASQLNPACGPVQTEPVEIEAKPVKSQRTLESHGL
jgi:hypothetical protein